MIKYAMLTLAILLASDSHAACPTLSGKYRCSSNANDYFRLSTSVSNGRYTYTWQSGIVPRIIADGAARNFDGSNLSSTRAYRGTYSATCDSTSVSISAVYNEFALTAGTIVNLGAHDEDMVFTQTGANTISFANVGVFDRRDGLQIPVNTQKNCTK